MTSDASLAQNIIGWAQVVIQGFVYPIGILIILGLAYVKFSQYVNSKIDKEE